MLPYKGVLQGREQALSSLIQPRSPVSQPTLEGCRGAHRRGKGPWSPPPSTGPPELRRVAGLCTPIHQLAVTEPALPAWALSAPPPRDALVWLARLLAGGWGTRSDQHRPDSPFRRREAACKTKRAQATLKCWSSCAPQRRATRGRASPRCPWSRQGLMVRREKRPVTAPPQAAPQLPCLLHSQAPSRWGSHPTAPMTAPPQAAAPCLPIGPLCPRPRSPPAGVAGPPAGGERAAGASPAGGEVQPGQSHGLLGPGVRHGRGGGWS